MRHLHPHPIQQNRLPNPRPQLPHPRQKHLQHHRVIPLPIPQRKIDRRRKPLQRTGRHRLRQNAFAYAGRIAIPPVETISDMIPPRLSTSWLGRISTPLCFINRSIASRSAGCFPEALIPLPETLRYVSPTISRIGLQHLRRHRHQPQPRRRDVENLHGIHLHPPKSSPGRSYPNVSPASSASSYTVIASRSSFPGNLIP
jgi:hypothetical protein